MALSNAERQRRYIARLKAAAGRNTAARAEEHRRRAIRSAALRAVQTEELNRFLRRLNRFWCNWADDLEAWWVQHPVVPPGGQKATISTLYSIADSVMHLAQDLDGR
jgi:hypothetical protein